MVVNYSGMYEVTGAKEATWCKVEKTGTVTSIPTATIAAADLAKYQGMAVTIANASVARQVFGRAPAHSLRILSLPMEPISPYSASRAMKEPERVPRRTF